MSSVFPNSTFSSLFSSNASSYVGPTYMATQAVGLFHGLPRGGYSNDVSSLISSNPLEQRNYIIGLLFLSILLMLIFFSWGLIILSFKCAGSKRVGFLSGSNFVQSTHYETKVDIERYISSFDSLEGSRETEVGLTEKLDNYRWPKRIRFFFIILSLMLMLLNILLTVEGVKHTSNTAYSVAEVTKETKLIVGEGLDTVRSLSGIGQSLEEVYVAVKDETGFESLCPGQDLTSLIGTDEIDLQDGIKQLEEVQTYIPLLAEFDNVLNKTHDIILSVEHALETYDTEWNWSLLIFTVPFILCCAFFVVGVILAWMDVSSCCIQFMLSYILLPIFVVLVIITSILASVFGIVATLNADSCIVPEATIKTAFDNYGINDTSLQYQLPFYILEGCHPTSNNPLTFIDTYQHQLQDVIISFNQFSAVTGSIGVENLNDICQRDVSTMISSIDILKSSFVDVFQIALNVLSLLSCERLNQLYVKTLHESFCTYSMSTFSWVYFILITISVCGWTLITLRSSWLDVLTIDSDGIILKLNNEKTMIEEYDSEPRASSKDVC